MTLDLGGLSAGVTGTTELGSHPLAGQLRLLHVVVVPKPKAKRGSKPHYKTIFERLCLNKFLLGKQMARLAKVSKERMHGKFYSYHNQ